MAAFTTNMTGTVALDENAVIAFTQAFTLENEQSQVLDANVVSINEQINAKSFNFPRYDTLAPVTSALTELDDPASVAMADNEVVITPAEYGNVITTSKLSNLQSGGRTDVGAAALVGRNAGRSQDKIALLTLDAGSGTTITPGGTAVGSLAATDVADAAFLEDAYHQLAKNSIPMLGDQYVMVAPDAVISDIRDDSAASGGWTDVNKYSAVERVLKNEVGMYKGFRIIRQNDCLLSADAGAGAVDVYNCHFLGFNALGKAVSNPASMTITGPYDKLNRFLNIGWYGCFGYSVVESGAAVLGRCAATRGANV